VNLVSAAAGVIPLPELDVTILAGIHIALINETSEHYGVAFSEHAARNIVMAVAASPRARDDRIGRRSPAAARAAFHHTGPRGADDVGVIRVVMAHFERGGTLDSFDVKNLHKLHMVEDRPRGPGCDVMM
jgi:hypothetical protein